VSETVNRRRAVRAGEVTTPRVERDRHVWRIRSAAAARQILGERRATTQAGFTAESIPKGYLNHHPILVSDGPLHDRQRSKVGRFFAPKVVAARYGTRMAECADRLLAEAAALPVIRLDELALHYTVEVTAQAVGLTDSPVPAMARRLVSFFNQPPFDITRDDLGRSNRDWMRAAWNGLLPVLRFYVFDVRPAIRSRRRAPREDVISHLIAEGYTNADILVECVTYGTAGMVTTREFIGMAAWHLLRHPELRSRYLVAQQPERLAILNEIIRLEPVVGHLYRRVQHPLSFDDDDGTTFIAEPGDLIDLCVRAANADAETVGPEPLDLRPLRPLPAGVDEAVLSFGHGAHRCPGQPLAMMESDALLHRLLARDVTIAAEPTIEWDDLIAGYALRGFDIRLG
jgi:cytochrome P450